MVPTNQPTVQLTPKVLHIVLRKPLLELAWWCEYVKEISERYLIGQHSADEDDMVTHIHTSLVNSNVTIEAIRKTMKKNGIAGSTEYAILTVTQKKRLPIDETKLGIYIMKGDIDTPRVTSYSDEIIAQFVELWVEPKPKVPVNSDDKKEKFDNYNALLKEFESTYPLKNRPSLDNIRTWVMKWHWKKYRRMPNATAYKRDAASLYMMHIEASQGCVETAYETLKEWAY